MHIDRQKNQVNFISVWSEIMSLKSDQLELGFSICCYHFMFEILIAMHAVQYVYILGDDSISSIFRSDPIYNVCNYCICMHLLEK